MLRTCSRPAAATRRGARPASAKTGAVPRFEPFRGLRYDVDRVDLAVVTAPPYDVIDDDDRAALAAGHPDQRRWSSTCPRRRRRPLRRGRPRPCARWLRRRRPGRDDDPSFYVYRMGSHRRDRRAAPHHRGLRRPRAEPARARAASSPTSTPRPRPRATGCNLLRAHRRQPLGRSGACRPRPGLSELLRARPARRWRAGPTTTASTTASGRSPTRPASRPSPPRSAPSPS